MNLLKNAQNCERVKMEKRDKQSDNQAKIGIDNGYDYNRRPLQWPHIKAKLCLIFALELFLCGINRRVTSGFSFHENLKAAAISLVTASRQFEFKSQR